VDDALKAHLVALPAPQLARVAKAVLGERAPSTPELTAHAVAGHLLDPQWVARTLQKLGPGAGAALAAVARAGVPVLRKDVSALVANQSTDPVDELEEHGLLVPIRTGRGMPTHVALPPGLGSVVQEQLQASEADSNHGSAFIGHRRRFDLALMLAIVAQYPPRVTRTGRVHAGDLARLTTHLAPLGLRASSVERHLSRWIDTGVAEERRGALRLNATAFGDVPQLFVILALTELAAPSVPEGALRVVERLARSGGSIDLRSALEITQAELLRNRSEDPEQPNRGAKTELLEVARSLLSLDALVMQDAEGHPIVLHDPDVAALQSAPQLALEPGIAAAILRAAAPVEVFHPGHVQSSFEVVADSGCDPTLVARIAVWAELVRADRAVVLRLERESVARAVALGFGVEQLFADLEQLAGRKPPANVIVLVKDWVGTLEPSEPMLAGKLAGWDESVEAARRAVLRENDPEMGS
jgi:hypothetical protein